MTRLLAAAVLFAAIGLSSTAVAGGPDPHHYTIEHNVAVRLPPGPCRDVGGRLAGPSRCVVPNLVYEPESICAHEHGVMATTAGGKRACAMRDPQSGLPTGQRQH